MKKSKPIFDGFDYGELCDAWGLNDPEPVNFRDECLELIKNTDYAIFETVGSWEEYKLRKHIHYLMDDFDNDCLNPGEIAKEGCRQIREYLTILSSHDDSYTPLFEGVLNIKDDFVLLRTFKCFLRHMWT